MKHAENDVTLCMCGAACLDKNPVYGASEGQRVGQSAVNLFEVILVSTVAAPGNTHSQPRLTISCAAEPQEATYLKHSLAAPATRRVH